MNVLSNLRIAYFGGEPLGVGVLQELKAMGITPKRIVCNPDRPKGRKHILTPPPVKVWAETEHIPTFQPESLKERTTLTPLTDEEYDLFVVVAYNTILPEWLINLPKHKTINLHPSLLPKLRGASPIRTAILEDNREAIGATVMLLDSEMDHGPILNQESLAIDDDAWPVPGRELDASLARFGGALLGTTIIEWIQGTIVPRAQDHDAATYTKKLTKEMGELALNPHALPSGEAAYQALLRIRAFDGFPGTFFFHNGKRIKIVTATLEDQALKIHSVIPEGKKEQSFEAFLDC